MYGNDRKKLLILLILDVLEKNTDAELRMLIDSVLFSKHISMAQAAGDKFRAADVDFVILQLLTYAASYNMLPVARDLDMSVVLVNIQKKAPDYENTDTAT